MAMAMASTARGGQTQSPAVVKPAPITALAVASGSSCGLDVAAP